MARGYLIRGVRTALWRDEAYSRQHFARAAALGATVDAAFLGRVTAQLLAYEAEMGTAATRAALARLADAMAPLGMPQEVRRLKGSLALNRAFADFHAGNFTTVPSSVVRATAHNPTYLGNRGALSILLRSVVANVRPGRA